MLEPIPLSRDVPAVRRLLRDALGATVAPGETPEEGLPVLDGLVNSGASLGRLLVEGGRPIGLALWEPPTPVGLFVHVLFFEPASASADRYRAALSAIESAAGPVAFLLRGLAGLPREAESELMRSLGFARYGRSEMRYAGPRSPPEFPLPRGVVLREPRADDAPSLAKLHQSAYAGGLDLYLFLSDPDPARDSERHIAEVLGGRHGPFLPSDSIVAADSADAVIGACLVVRAGHGPLIVDVMVDPSRRGVGLARAMVSASVRELQASGEPSVALNVTEGNVAAVRAYTSVGFVRTIGPQWNWFSEARIPVEPGRA